MADQAKKLKTTHSERVIWNDALRKKETLKKLLMECFGRGCCMVFGFCTVCQLEPDLHFVGIVFV